MSSGSDPRHALFEELGLLLAEIFWPHVLAPVLSELQADGRIGSQELLIPFKGLTAGQLEQPLRSAANQLFGLDCVAATQGWTLLVEPIVRARIDALGGTTTRVASDGSGDREATLDVAIEQLEALESKLDASRARRTATLLSGVFSNRGYGWNWRNLVAHGLMPAWRPFTAWVAYIACVAIMLPCDAQHSGGVARTPQDAPERPEDGDRARS